MLAERGEGGPGREGGPVAEEEVEDEERGPVPAAMDQCVTVERELEKVLQKFSGYGQLCERSLEELIQYAGGLRREILQTESTWRPPDPPYPSPGGRLLPPGLKGPKLWTFVGWGSPLGRPPLPALLWWIREGPSAWGAELGLCFPHTLLGALFVFLTGKS